MHCSKALVTSNVLKNGHLLGQLEDLCSISSEVRPQLGGQVLLGSGRQDVLPLT